MVLHPSGGTIEHLIKMSSPLRITHSLAIFCLPLILFGFYGITHKLLGKWRLSILAFISMSFGLIVAMLAALFNGLILPYFIDQYSERIVQNSALVKPIVNYGFAINKALVYVFIVAFCSSIAIYSLIIIKSKKLSKWIGYFGLAIFLFAIIGWISNFAFTNLLGFRIFVFGIAGWILCSGIALIRFKK